MERPRDPCAREVDHRRNENGALEPAFAGMGGANDCPAHRMGERKMRPWTFGSTTCCMNAGKVDLVLESFRHAPCVDRQLPGGMALPPPIYRRDWQTAVAQFANRFEIFLDEFAAAAADTDCSPTDRRRSQLREAQLHVIGVPDLADNGAIGNRITGRRDKSYRSATGHRCYAGRPGWTCAGQPMPLSHSTPPIRCMPQESEHRFIKIRSRS